MKFPRIIRFLPLFAILATAQAVIRSRACKRSKRGKRKNANASQRALATSRPGDQGELSTEFEVAVCFYRDDERGADERGVDGDRDHGHFERYDRLPHLSAYKGGYINIDKARNSTQLLRKLLQLNESTFLFWGADDTGDVFTGYTFTLESGFPDEAIKIVLSSIRNSDQFVGELRPSIDGTNAP